ncbi:hypothetical protein TNCV_3159591 [Trichonephila clavipes]|nr:hypothetical protein TNCV_3159591 [Trichonephila clavipes]
MASVEWKVKSVESQSLRVGVVGGLMSGVLVTGSCVKIVRRQIWKWDLKMGNRCPDDPDQVNETKLLYCPGQVSKNLNSSDLLKDTGDGPRHFELQSSDENDNRTGTPSLNDPITPTGGRLSLDRFQVHRLPPHGGSSVPEGLATQWPRVLSYRTCSPLFGKNVEQIVLNIY